MDTKDSKTCRVNDWMDTRPAPHHGADKKDEGGLLLLPCLTPPVPQLPETILYKNYSPHLKMSNCGPEKGTLCSRPHITSRRSLRLEPSLTGLKKNTLHNIWGQ